MRFEPSGMTNDPDIRAKSIVDYIFRWMGKKFLTVDQQEEIGILSAEVRAGLAEGYRNGGDAPASLKAPTEMAPPGQTALFSAFEDAQGVPEMRGADGADRQLLHVQGLRD